MEYSKNNTVTRKEYLKSKNKQPVNFKIFKYILLIIVVILLVIYLFKQLNVYNNVTKMANKVVEETALAKTMKMYYVSNPYSRNSDTMVMMYKASDESRTEIKNSEKMKCISAQENVLYGIIDNKLYALDMTKNTKEQLVEQDVAQYVVKDDIIYFYSDNKDKTGIYKLDVTNKKTTKIVNDEVYQMIVDDAIYVVTNGKTSRTIVKFNLNGTGRIQLTDKQIVKYILKSEDKIYFVNSSDDDKIYSVYKNGGNITKISDSSCYISNDVKNNFDAQNIMAVYKDKLYYLNANKENMLYEVDLKTSKENVIVKKNIGCMQINSSVIYFKLNGSLKLFKYDIANLKTEAVTSIRSNEFVCYN